MWCDAKMICILRDDMTLIMWFLSPIFLGLRIFPPLVVSLWNLLIFCSQKFFGIPLVCNNTLVSNVKSLFVFLTLISFLKVLFLLLLLLFLIFFNLLVQLSVWTLYIMLLFYQACYLSNCISSCFLKNKFLFFEP